MADTLQCKAKTQRSNKTKDHVEKGLSLGNGGGIARIELATSCTLSKNHTTRPNAQA